MKDWNVVVSVHDRGFIRACEVLGELGYVGRTEYHNVLVMKVGDIRTFLDDIRQLLAEDPLLSSVFSRVVPVSETFTFQTAEEFEARAEEAALKWVPDLAGKSFYVRMHRRGFKGRISSQVEERRLSGVLMTALEAGGKRVRVSFEDADAVVAVETVGGRAGLSLWTRSELLRYPFLRLG
jgi:tRNA(Ser,Leu) C12 N-acetylase TAN1